MWCSADSPLSAMPTLKNSGKRNIASAVMKPEIFVCTLVSVCLFVKRIARVWPFHLAVAHRHRSVPTLRRPRCQ